MDGKPSLLPNHPIYSVFQSKKVVDYVWSIRWDIGQALRKQKIFPPSCCSALLAKAQFLELAQSPIYVFFQRFANRGLVRKVCQNVLDMFLQWSKTVYFRQITLFKVFPSFGWVRDICLVIDYLAAAGSFSLGFYHLWSGMHNNWSLIKHSRIKKEVA